MNEIYKDILLKRLKKYRLVSEMETFVIMPDNDGVHGWNKESNIKQHIFFNPYTTVQCDFIINNTKISNN